MCGAGGVDCQGSAVVRSIYGVHFNLPFTALILRTLAPPLPAPACPPALSPARPGRSVGITVPILPGVMPVMAYAGFKRMTGFCKTAVPQHIADTLEAIKGSEEAVKAYGISMGTFMCQRLLSAGAPGVHMYTLNLEKAAGE